MNENIERKVDMLISGMKIPKKKTRSRVVTIATTMLIASVLIASASLFEFYYLQTGTIEDIKGSITITPPGGTAQDVPWSDEASIGIIYAGDTYIHPGGTDFYTITNNALTTQTVYIHTDVTETLSDPPGVGDGLGLTVEVWNVDGTPTIIKNAENGGPPQIPLEPGKSVKFEIHIVVDSAIDHTSTYGYTLTMNSDEA